MLGDQTQTQPPGRSTVPVVLYQCPGCAPIASTAVRAAARFGFHLSEVASIFGPSGNKGADGAGRLEIPL